jgi:hypothetical protein
MLQVGAVAAFFGARMTALPQKMTLGASDLPRRRSAASCRACSMVGGTVRYQSMALGCGSERE